MDKLAKEIKLNNQDNKLMNNRVFFNKNTEINNYKVKKISQWMNKKIRECYFKINKKMKILIFWQVGLKENLEKCD